MIYATTFLLVGIILRTHALFHQQSMTVFKAPSSLNNASFFGYSIAYEPYLQSFIVGAPRASHIGKIYVININNSSTEEVTFPIERPEQQSIKHDFWLGANVKSNTNSFVACIPRYAELKTNHKQAVKKRKLATVGVCYLKSEDSKPVQLKTISKSQRNLNTGLLFKKQMDAFGWGMDMTSQNELLIGSPAVPPGRVIKYDKTSQSARPSLIHKISPTYPVTNNFGYSIASGKFFSEEITYAVSTPFGNMGYGKVYFFNSKLENIETINDDDLGTMFGAALCSANLGGVALLIGAPAFADSDETYDVGAVYIYTAQSGSLSKEMYRKRTIKGKTNGAYFGNAIVNLGDMDGDSKDEIAIAAPYDDDGRGAIYIYTGEGILQGIVSQKLQPEGLTNFGHSMTVVKDFNENGVNDLAVTSLDSSSIILFKSMPVLTIKLFTMFPNLQDHKNETYFEFQSCLNVTGYPKKLNKINADIVVTVMKTDPISKLVDADGKGVLTYEVSLRDKNETYCKNIGVLSKLTPVSETNLVIAYKISAVLKENPMERDDYDISRVVLSERSILSESGEKSITDCGGGVCVPIWTHSINSTISSPYLIGSSDLEIFTISVKNIGNTAYGACMFVTVLEANILRPPDGCTLIKDTSIFLCKPYQPIRNDKDWVIQPIQVETTLLTSGNDKLTTRSELFNNCDNQTQKIILEKIIPLKSDFKNIIIKGQANPEENVSMTLSDVNYAGKNMDHLYTISNNGKTNWIGIQSEIVLDNVPFVNYSGAPITISKDKSSGIECTMANSNKTDTKIKVLCDIGDLKRNQKAQVLIAITIPPKTLEFKEDNENVTIITTLNLILNNETISSSLQTVVYFVTVAVPLWVKIVSSLVGIIILVIISYILYKRGFLRRENKEKLKALKKSVHRQSMRRSMIRDSMRATANRRSTEDLHSILAPVKEEDSPDSRVINELRHKFQ